MGVCLPQQLACSHTGGFPIGTRPAEVAALGRREASNTACVVPTENEAADPKQKGRDGRAGWVFQDSGIAT